MATPTLVAIRSADARDHFISLDATGLTSFTGAGGGVVSIKSSVGPNETFILQRNDDGTVSFGSTAFDQVFLRMNTDGVPQGENLPQGGGVVNAQYTARSLERFRIQKKAGDQYQGVVGIESAANPGRFLRLDHWEDKVNVQGVAKSLEGLEILVLG